MLSIIDIIQWLRRAITICLKERKSWKSEGWNLGIVCLHYCSLLFLHNSYAVFLCVCKKLIFGYVWVLITGETKSVGSLLNSHRETKQNNVNNYKLINFVPGMSTDVLHFRTNLLLSIWNGYRINEIYSLSYDFPCLSHLWWTRLCYLWL